MPVPPVTSPDDVIVTPELERRPLRVRSAQAEARAMEALRQAVAGSPRALLQKLAEVALELCAAQSAGVSLLEDAEGKRVFRWYATAGAFAPLLWATLPRDFSPCGTVLDRQECLLMREPVRYYTPLAQVRPQVIEALLVPLQVEGEPVGTVWIAMHEEDRTFDADDRRIVTELTRFAAAAYGRLKSFGAGDIEALSFMHRSPLPERKPR